MPRASARLIHRLGKCIDGQSRLGRMLQWIESLQGGKSCEVAIGSADGSSVFDRYRCQSSVRYERPRHLAVYQKVAQDLPMTFTRV
jgi:hypothetical protein